MTKIVWDQVGNRRYETGLDRGVLYPVSGNGVPWSGLISVNETPSGGDAKALYYDGYKYHNRAALTEFEGTLEAYTYPPEFEICDGTQQVGRGLYFGHQRRKPFGLCYRTKVGNDLAGVDYGYKLHIIYNALASPSAKNFSTISDRPDPVNFSWSFTTKPVLATGYRPVPEIVVNSTETQLSLLSALEDILYGSSSANARLPLPAEVMSLFTGWPEMYVIDNGDGTFTVDGPDSMVSLLNSTTFQISSPSVTDNGNGTFTAASSS